MNLDKEDELRNTIRDIFSANTDYPYEMTMAFCEFLCKSMSIWLSRDPEIMEKEKDMVINNLLLPNLKTYYEMLHDETRMHK